VIHIYSLKKKRTNNINTKNKPTKNATKNKQINKINIHIKQTKNTTPPPQQNKKNENQQRNYEHINKHK